MPFNRRQKMKIAIGVMGIVLFALYPIPIAFRLGVIGLILIATVWAVWYRRDRNGM